MNIGVGEAVADSKKARIAAEDLALIAGQKPVITKAKKSIATFKVREDMPLGAKVDPSPPADVRIPGPPDHHRASARS